jgi:hypothetical protein
MPFSNVVNGTARRCKAKSKSTGEQCWHPAVKNWTVCRCHGYNPNVKKGSEHHWFVHGESTRQLKREMPAINKRLKEFAYALETKDYSKLPETPELKKLRKERDKILKKLRIEAKPKAPIRTLAEARAAIKPKPKYIPSPAQRAKVAAYQKVYQPKYRAKQKALKAEAKQKAELERQLYLQSTKRK